MQRGAIVLCGGQSSRMGQDKSWLPFGPETLLQRVVRTVCTRVDPARAIVVAASGQVLPELPAGIQIVCDHCSNRGPLQGLEGGLVHLAGRADVVYVTSCDVPLLQPAFIDCLFELLGDHQVVVPQEGVHLHPLAAVYRTTVLPQIQQLLAADRLRLRSLLDVVDTRYVPVEDLRSVDPSLDSLQNVNQPDDYRRVLSAAGF